jgi:hypothetical protein
MSRSTKWATCSACRTPNALAIRQTGQGWFLRCTASSCSATDMLAILTALQEKQEAEIRDIEDALDTLDAYQRSVDVNRD